MKLTTRLVLAGAVVPAALLLAGAGAGGLVFQHYLVEGVDRTLLGQAAVEVVSLFDGPGRAPHLHLDESPLASELEPYAASGGLYGPDGRLILVYPPYSHLPAALPPPRIDGESGQTHLRTAASSAHHLRILTVNVRSPSGAPHTLMLAASLEPVQEAVRLYYRTVGLGLVLVLFVGGGFQVWHARSIGLRVQALAGHMARLRDGNFADAPPPDEHADELADLRDSVADATEKLAAAHDSHDRLVADAAHELRTPLAAMRTTIDVTLRRPRSGEELGRTLSELRQEVIRLGDLATKLLDLARLRASRVEQQPGDLRRVIEEAVERYRRVAEERRVTVAVEGPAEAPGLFAVDALRQALENLLSNALRYAPAESRVVVALGPLPGPEPGWRVVVRDQGRGVPPEQREVIFEAFHRLDHREEGAGLGLAIVRDIVRQHGGRVYVSPEVTSGAELVVELPHAAPVIG